MPFGFGGFGSPLIACCKRVYLCCGLGLLVVDLGWLDLLCWFYFVCFVVIVVDALIVLIWCSVVLVIVCGVLWLVYCLIALVDALVGCCLFIACWFSVVGLVCILWRILFW